MVLSPRKAEIEAVVDLLQHDGFENETMMAKAIIKEVASLLSQRATLGVAVGYSGPGLAVGPFYDTPTARRFLKEAQEVGWETRLARLSGTGTIRAAQVLHGLCECGHRPELHPASDRCKVIGCKCKVYK